MYRKITAVVLVGVLLLVSFGCMHTAEQTVDYGLAVNWAYLEIDEPARPDA